MNNRHFIHLLPLSLVLILISSCETKPPVRTGPDAGEPPVTEAPTDAPAPLANEEVAESPSIPVENPEGPRSAREGGLPSNIPDLPGLSLRPEPPLSREDFVLDEGSPPQMPDEPLSQAVPEALASAAVDVEPPRTQDRDLPAVSRAPEEQKVPPTNEGNGVAPGKRGDLSKKEQLPALKPRPEVPDTPPVPAAPPASTAITTDMPRLGETAVPEEVLPAIPPLAITPPLMPEKEPVFSRTVRALVGQLVEVPYYGAGWVYLGERFSRPGLDYRGRRVDDEGQSFTFVAREEGVWELSFFRHDFVEDRSTPDHVRLIVTRPPDAAFMGRYPEGAESRVVAERWPNPATSIRSLSPAAGSEGGATPAAPGPMVPAVVDAPIGPSLDSDRSGDEIPISMNSSPEVSLPLNLSSEELLERARTALVEQKGATANELLERYLEQEPQGSPAAFLLFARIHELEGPSRDIKRARYWYSRIIAEFPLSGESLEADSRIKYLDRFYFGIR